MKTSRFNEDQIIGILKTQQAGLPATDICRRHWISDATFYTWRSRYGGMEVSDARRLKTLDEDNRRFSLSIQHHGAGENVEAYWVSTTRMGVDRGEV